MNAARLVTAAGWSAIPCGVLGFAASLGHGPLPALPASWTWPLHLALLLLGGVAARVAAVRHAELDRARFAYANDPHATKGERELAHKEAERGIRLAHTALVAFPLALGYWLAYEFAPGATAWARALPATALVGFAAGSLVSRRRGGASG